MTTQSASDPRFGIAIFSGILKDQRFPEMSGAAGRQYFEERVAFLQSEQLLAPDVGCVDWGILRRKHPLCQAYGELRGGTPVDRYYLDHFVRLIRPEVRGDVLEIGGRRENKKKYNFDQATEYRSLDLPGMSDDIEGDATDATVVEEKRFDCILAFNVLEHCEKPQLVVDNIFKWLKPGGKAIVVVPTAQKIHAAPKDYWRPLPDALRSMFKEFGRCELQLYGNLKAVIANLTGISSEELTESELMDYHPDYLVVSCAIAVK